MSEIDNTYVKEAAAAGKWAFVSDYMRLHALYKHGGFYFDSDLEVTAPIDQFRHYGFVTGFEKTLDGKRVRNSRLMINLFLGSPRKHFIRYLINFATCSAGGRSNSSWCFCELN